jgi:hypothetical protein
MLFDFAKTSKVRTGSQNDYTQVAIFAKLRCPSIENRSFHTPKRQIFPFSFSFFASRRGASLPRNEDRNFLIKRPKTWRRYSAIPTLSIFM